MTYQNDFTLSEALLDQPFLEQLSANGLDALPFLGNRAGGILTPHAVSP